MASQRQVEANRSNAKRSTGPTTQRGKARSRTNAFKHGLAAREIVIGNEDPKQFEALGKGLQAYFRPLGTMEVELVDRITGLLWRLRRVPAVESSMVRILQEEQERAELARASSENENDTDLLIKRLICVKVSKSIKDEGGSVLSALKDGTYKERLEAERKKYEAMEEQIRLSPATEEIEKMDPSERENDSGLRLLFSDGNSDATLGKLTRYETTLMNNLVRTINLLHLVQQGRNSSDNGGIVLLSHPTANT